MTYNWYDVILAEMGLRRHPIIRLKNGLSFIHEKNRFMFEVFLDEPYGMLDVSGRDVVDVGMSFGDSALYFAMKGAKHVYAYEPMPKNFSLARANLALNRFKNILIFNAAVGSHGGSVRIDPQVDTGIATSLYDSKIGIPIEVLSLNHIVHSFSLQNAALKLDCEGAEFDILLNSPNETLQAFSEIVLEYHKEPNSIVSLLDALNFSILRKGDLYRGIIYAKRNGEPRSAV